MSTERSYNVMFSEATPSLGAVNPIVASRVVPIVKIDNKTDSPLPVPVKVQVAKGRDKLTQLMFVISGADYSDGESLAVNYIISDTLKSGKMVQQAVNTSSAVIPALTDGEFSFLDITSDTNGLATSVSLEGNITLPANTEMNINLVLTPTQISELHNIINILAPEAENVIELGRAVVSDIKSVAVDDKHEDAGDFFGTAEVEAEVVENNAKFVPEPKEEKKSVEEPEEVKEGEDENEKA